MESRVGRPKLENPKNIDVKVRFDEQSYKSLLEYCKNNNLKKTDVLRKGVDKLLNLNKGLEYSHIKEYENFLKDFDIENFNSIDKESKRKQIQSLTSKLNELYGIIDKVRDHYLMSQYNFTYKELFNKSVEVRMPVDPYVFTLQREYYNLIMKLYEIIKIY